MVTSDAKIYTAYVHDISDSCVTTALSQLRYLLSEPFNKFEAF